MAIMSNGCDGPEDAASVVGFRGALFDQPVRRPRALPRAVNWRAIHVCSPSCYKYHSKGASHICRHNFYHVATFADAARRIDGVRRRCARGF